MLGVWGGGGQAQGWQCNVFRLSSPPTPAPGCLAWASLCLTSLPRAQQQQLVTLELVMTSRPGEGDAHTITGLSLPRCGPTHQGSPLGDSAHHGSVGPKSILRTKNSDSERERKSLRRMYPLYAHGARLSARSTPLSLHTPRKRKIPDTYEGDTRSCRGHNHCPLGSD